MIILDVYLKQETDGDVPIRPAIRPIALGYQRTTPFIVTTNGVVLYFNSHVFACCKASFKLHILLTTVQIFLYLFGSEAVV